MEIITGVERRRRWRAEEKLRIVAELDEPGACFAEIARRHDVSRGLLWNWRRQVRSGALRAATDLGFLPVQVMPEPAPTVSRPAKALSPASSVVPEGTIEITLPDGTTVRVKGEVGAATLRRVLGALRG